MNARHFFLPLAGIALLATLAHGQTASTTISATSATLPTASAGKEGIPPTIEMRDFFRNPDKSGFQISPDGQYFSYRAPWKNRMNIFVQKVGAKDATQVTFDTIRDVGG